MTGDNTHLAQSPNRGGRCHHCHYRSEEGAREAPRAGRECPSMRLELHYYRPRRVFLGSSPLPDLTVPRGQAHAYLEFLCLCFRGDLCDFRKGGTELFDLRGKGFHLRQSKNSSQVCNRTLLPAHSSRALPAAWRRLLIKAFVVREGVKSEKGDSYSGRSLAGRLPARSFISLSLNSRNQKTRRPLLTQLQHQ